MSRFELKLPKMGESVAEATLTTWLKEVGDTIEMDEAIFEIATDKVDSEVPSEVDGVLVERLYEVDDVIKVGATVAIIEIEGDSDISNEATNSNGEIAVDKEILAAVESTVEVAKEVVAAPVQNYKSTDRFYSPLVKNIAKQEGVTGAELDTISGTGKDARVTKSDILAYVAKRKQGNVSVSTPEVQEQIAVEQVKLAKEEVGKPQTKALETAIGDETLPMSRMGKLIAKHMVESVSTSAHVQSFIEVDVTNLVNWRKKVKDTFEKREGEKLTFTPIFFEAVAKALKAYPLMNISVDGDNVIKKRNINLGMATALPDGNLIVPVIKNADQLNLVGMAKAVNDLANRARNNKLKPDDTQDGTYTVTNVGTFGSVFGTPIINQPQVGILALGAIRKTPSVIETAEGDFIGIRNKMFLSHSYDHRVVNGALGSMFVKAIADYLESWDINREV